MDRIEAPLREQFDGDELAAFDAFMAARGQVRGPYIAYLHHPLLARRISELGAQLRFASVLPDADRELAILVASAELGAAFELTAHLPIARAAGAEDDAIGVAAAPEAALDGLSARSRLVIGSMRALLREHTLPRALLQQLEGTFGRKGALELVAISGLYAMVGHVLSCYGIEP